MNCSLIRYACDDIYIQILLNDGIAPLIHEDHVFRNRFDMIFAC